MAKSGCWSAYPDEESAKKAVRPLSSASFAPLIAIDEGEEITSMDPNEVMAKAYMKDNKEEEKSKPKEDAGPLGFLGLQRKSNEDDDKKEER